MARSASARRMRRPARRADAGTRRRARCRSRHGGDPHESPAVVTLPLIALAIPSVIIGAFTVGSVLFGSYFGDSIFVLPAERRGRRARRGVRTARCRRRCMGLLAPPFWLALAGVVTAWVCLPVAAGVGGRDAARRFRWLHTLLINKYYFDWFNENVLAALTRVHRRRPVEGRRPGADRRRAGQRHGARRSAGSAALMRRVQSGYLYSLRVLDDDRPGGAARLVPGARLATSACTHARSPVDPDLAAHRGGRRWCCCSASAASSPGAGWRSPRSLATLAAVGAAVDALQHRHRGACSSSRTLPWIPRFHAYYALGVDGISLPLIVLTAFMTVPVVIAGWTVIETRAGAVLRRLPHHGRPDDRGVLAPPMRCCSISSGKRC